MVQISHIYIHFCVFVCQGVESVSHDTVGTVFANSVVVSLYPQEDVYLFTAEQYTEYCRECAYRGDGTGYSDTANKVDNGERYYNPNNDDEENSTNLYTAIESGK